MMKNIKLIVLAIMLVLLCIGCQNDKNAAETGTTTKEDEMYVITDMSGRDVEIKKNITKVFGTGPIANIILYTIDSELMVGVNWAPSESEKAYLDDYYLQLPVLGGWYGNGNEGNIEEIIKADPDIIINAGSISESTINFSDKLQEQTGIPVINVDFEFNEMANAYDFLGNILNKKIRTDELAAYIREAYEDVGSKKALIAEKDKVTVYYAEGPEGLQTDPEGSNHSALISYVGGINIADVDVSSGYGRTTVSVEQLISWNPDIILVCPENNDTSAYEVLLEDDVYKTISAVKTKDIYEMPNKPFKWFDRPPSSNRIIGIKWTANVLYPDVYNYDMKEETKKFYELFYRCTLSDKQVQQLLNRSVRE